MYTYCKCMFLIDTHICVVKSFPHCIWYTLICMSTDNISDVIYMYMYIGPWCMEIRVGEEGGKLGEPQWGKGGRCGIFLSEANWKVCAPTLPHPHCHAHVGSRQNNKIEYSIVSQVCSPLYSTKSYTLQCILPLYYNYNYIIILYNYYYSLLLISLWRVVTSSPLGLLPPSPSPPCYYFSLTILGSNGPQRFCIKKLGNPDALPRSHTW